MSAIRTITCPSCGKRHLIGSACPTDARAARTGSSRSNAIVLSLVVTALTAGLLSATSLAAADLWGRGYGIAIVLGVWIIVQLFRLGYDFEDGIDLMKLFLLPFPWDWSARVERFVSFWTSPRLWFRAMYIGCSIALVAVIIVLANSRPTPSAVP
jgi:hypothetical protein